MVDYPLVVFVFSLSMLWVSARIGAYFQRRSSHLEEGIRQDLGVILAAGLTMLGLIIGFTFSMAVTRYDQRKNYEEAEANAIGTEFLRAELLSPAGASKVRELLSAYVDQRILFYTTRSAEQLDRINTATTRLQNDLWSVVRSQAQNQPTPLMGLIVGGMNDVLNSQGYSQAAWWNRIPTAAWVLMAGIAICCTVLFGYTSRQGGRQGGWFLTLPLLVSISFFLIADLDSPRGGVVRVAPQNLLSFRSSISAP
jgi:hypothetical protein